MRPVGSQGEEAGSAPLGRFGGPAALGAREPCDNAKGWLFPAGWPDGALGMSET